MRNNHRKDQEMRPVSIITDYTRHAEGSVLIAFGDTKVICTASVVDSVPKFLKDTGKGWLTAEYGMLPRATHTRSDREASRGKQGGRTMEIQRLIGRALRSVVDLSAIGEKTITIDCDVIQADGGTRTAAITGGCVALVSAINYLRKKYNLPKDPFKRLVAAVSVGICNGKALLDLDYSEDSQAETDMNVVMREDDSFIEVQGTAERDVFSQVELNAMLELAKQGMQELFKQQRQALGGRAANI